MSDDDQLSNLSWCVRCDALTDDEPGSDGLCEACSLAWAVLCASSSDVWHEIDMTANLVSEQS